MSTIYFINRFEENNSKGEILIMGLRNRIAEYSNKTAVKKCGPKKKMKKTSILDVTFCGYS